MEIDEIIIVGGGASIEPVLPMLKEKLTGKCVFTLNYAHAYLPSTATIYVDDTFYVDEFNNLEHLPLIIGKKYPQMNLHPNTISLKDSPIYHRDLVKGIYSPCLCGIFALSYAIWLEPKVISILGFDYGVIDNKKDDKGKPRTHFYTDKIHRGLGKCNWYEGEPGVRCERDFGVFRGEKQVKIYNVSLKSNLETFTKISYSEFFLDLDKTISKNYNQEKLREYIKNKTFQLQREQNV